MQRLGEAFGDHLAQDRQGPLHAAVPLGIGAREDDGLERRLLRVLPDGRWFDAELHTWRDARGKEAVWPDMVDACRMRKTKVILAACHRDHDPPNVKPKNLAA
ncbi:hypothetical protein FW320_14450 [Azospirillum sp. Vi22]|uniref:hypothetical protein n=1 Tax=Azospirillum baldaniorum TaxID=1064539 RepID=UPI00157B930C|nr:hypothetical protein [Azospirillum baldaniorum]NUB07372.1 hypothetical protein [Azospirillum baldaniorum]